MGTSIRPEVSSKKEYWLSRHRYYELKHFCLQYPEWKRNYRALDGFAPHSPGLRERVSRTPGDPVTGCVAERLYYRERMEIVETAAREAADDLGALLTKAVTEGIVRIVLEGASLLVPAALSSYWMMKGLTFEQNGTFTSRTQQWLSSHLRLFRK